MKKLMIAAAIVCAAAVSQAANYKWSCLDDGVGLPGQGEGSDYYTGTAYLFDSSTTQQSLLTAFLAGTDITAGAISSASIDDNGATSSPFIYNGRAAGTDWNAYMVVVNGKDIFFSDLSSTISTPYDESTTGIFIPDPWEASTADYKGGETYAGSGWYQAVPEPTSGLLLLLGVAGLALRRRRA